MFAARDLLFAVAIFPLTLAAADAAPKKIATEDEFVAAVVGKALVDDKGNEIMLGRDGKITGTLGGSKITASKWEWNKDKFCRSLATAKKSFPSACQDVTFDGKVATFGTAKWMLK